VNESIAVSVENLSKSFRIYRNPKDRLKQLFFRNRIYYHEFRALSSVSFKINKGEFIGIVGRNGSGKSTLLQMIAGTLTPSTGHVYVSGRVAALLELGSGFNPDFTGRENVFLNGAILGIGKKEMEEKFQDIVSFADIGDFIDQPVKTYSSGMYVRLAFAVAINVNPEILIVDEALAVGDGRFQLKCFEKIKSMKEAGTTIIFVSHDLQSIRQFCDRCFLFDKGKFLESGLPNDIVNRYTKILFGSNPNETAITANEQKSSLFSGVDSNTSSDKEYRYGNKEGIIEHTDILNESGESVKVLTTCEKFIVCMKIIAKADIEKPIFALTIKSVRGLEVYGTNTYFQNMPFFPLKSGDRCEIRFQQHLSLMPGDYFISLGFVKLEHDDFTPLDRRYDTMELKILPNGHDRSFGIANLESRILMAKI